MDLEEKDGIVELKVQQQLDRVREAEECSSCLDRSELLQDIRTDTVKEELFQAQASSEGANNEIGKRKTNQLTLLCDDIERTLAITSLNDNEDPQEGPSGSSLSRQSFNETSQGPSSSSHNVMMPWEIETGKPKSSRYNSYLERYGPEFERYRNQLERFGNHLERIGPQLERCGSNLERYGPQLEAIGRQLQRTSTERRNSVTESTRTAFPEVQTQTESGNEGYAPQGVDSCQGSTTSQQPIRNGTWASRHVNPRRLSRRPSFQVNDGLIRNWMRRRNNDNRDSLPLRFGDDRRRFLWRNEGELRRIRGIPPWRGVDNFAGRRYQQNNSLNNDTEFNHPERALRHSSDDRHGSGQYSLDQIRTRRNETIHHDDPNFGFVLIDNDISPGSSESDATAQQERRQRSHMSLRSLNVSSPPMLGPIIEYNAEHEDEINVQRQNIYGRRSFRGRDGSNIRSWVAMTNYFQPRPLYIGQGDSKAMDGPYNVLSLPMDEVVQNS